MGYELKIITACSPLQYEVRVKNTERGFIRFRYGKVSAYAKSSDPDTYIQVFEGSLPEKLVKEAGYPDFIGQEDILTFCANLILRFS